MAFCFGKQHPHGLLILLGFTLCEAYSVAFIAIHYTASSVLLGCGITASVFIGLTAYTLYTKSDFNYLGAALASALWIMIIGGFMQWLFFPNDSFARIGLACLGAAVACGYILYDTSEIMYRSTPDDVVIACLNLYIDIIMLFIKILELVGKKRD
jgi:FtsH-binding integral membrane protein